MTKISVGRLRPHFLTICKPDYSKPGLCKDEWGFQKFVDGEDEEICLGLEANGGNTTTAMLYEARLSFVSGHSSLSFFSATFLIIYLQARLSNFPQVESIYIRTFYKVTKVVRPIVQFSLASLALWISLTRISDYFHHPVDVAAGGLIGILFACITLLGMFLE